MSKLIKMIFVCVLVSIGYAPAWANPTLAEYVEKEISSFDLAFEALDSDSQVTDDYFLRRFWLRLRPKVGLTVPELAALEIIPEIEMLWEKEVPEGWEIYKP